MSLAPYSCRRHKDEACKADSKQMVARQEGNVGKGKFKVECQGKGVGGEER